MAVQSDCGSTLSYNLTVSNPESSSSLLLTNNSARVPVDGSHTVTIFASNGCPGVAEKFGEWMHRHHYCYINITLSVISTTCVTPSSTAPAAHSKQ